MDVLLVEDHHEVRGALRELLEAEEFGVSAVASAEEALELAAGKTFGLLVTDENLPGKSGSQLVQLLRDRGQHLPTLIVTAGANLPDISGVRVLLKPMDLDVFMSTVHALIGTTPVERKPSPEAPPPPARVQLRLYVSSRSAASVRAVNRLRALLGEYDPSDFRVDTFDFEHGVPAQADADRVLTTPSLLVLLPDGRRTWVLGDLRSTESLELVLESAGVRRRSPR